MFVLIFLIHGKTQKHFLTSLHAPCRSPCRTSSQGCTYKPISVSEAWQPCPAPVILCTYCPYPRLKSQSGTPQVLSLKCPFELRAYLSPHCLLAGYSASSRRT